MNRSVAETARMVCLAFSEKRGGKCVARVRMDSKRGQWLRPAGMNAEGELYPAQYRLPDLSDPAPGDILDVPLFETVSRKAHHPEDRRVAGVPWGHAGRMEFAELAPLLESVRVCGAELFGCREKRVLPQVVAAQKMPSSLAVIRPAEVRFQVENDPKPARVGETSRPRYRVWFFLDGAIYELPLTDPVFKKGLRPFNVGSYSCADLGLTPGRSPFLVCSLGEPYVDGYCYKLVATVLAS